MAPGQPRLEAGPELTKELAYLQTTAFSQAAAGIRRTEGSKDAASEAARCDHAVIAGRIAELQRTLAGAPAVAVRAPERMSPDRSGRPAPIPTMRRALWIDRAANPMDRA